MNTTLQQEVRNAIAILRSGGVILYPTDTIWGLGCDARNSTAVGKLFQIKERPAQMSMLVLVESIERLEHLVGKVPSIVLEELVHTTRPTTIIYPHVKGVTYRLLAADGTLGIRLVQHTFCEALIAELDAPIVSTSANITGQPAGRKLSDISTTIKERVDGIVDESFDTSQEEKGSRILKLSGNSFEVIRA
ncbi:MAG: L-threonylcarbamoyladenylate synthase [Bacteroides sp.]